MRLKCKENELYGELHFNHSLQKMNSWKVGGASDCFYSPADISDLSYFLCHCIDDEPVIFLGLGSNVLIRDVGVRGVVIATCGVLSGIKQVDRETVCAEAGVTCARLARYCGKRGLGGLEFLAGVPGTVGGALAMNAGAFGSEIWERVTMVEMIDRQGRLYQRIPAEFDVDYRSVRWRREEWFVAGYFKLPPELAEQLHNTMRNLLKRRNASQPVSQFNCGSVFRNPKNDYAGHLIEICGLKGYTIGDAQVSEEHANFIINNGNASAADIERLIYHMQSVVAQKTGIELTLEVKIIGGERC